MNKLVLYAGVAVLTLISVPASSQTPQITASAALKQITKYIPVSTEPHMNPGQKRRTIVRLHVQLANDGSVENIKLIQGHPLLAPKAIFGVKDWKFLPFVQSGKPVSVTFDINVPVKNTTPTTLLEMKEANPRSDSANATLANYDVKRCSPKVVKHGPHPKNIKIDIKKNGKPSGYQPVVSFEILESGEVSKVRLKRRSGYADVDQYAMKWMQGTTYNSRPDCGVIESEAVVLVHWIAAE